MTAGQVKAPRPILVIAIDYAEPTETDGTMSGSAITYRSEGSKQPIPRDLSGAHGIVGREDLLAALDRATARKVTGISAPPGSAKTWLLRAWAARSGRTRRVAFVSVERDQRDPQQFWLSRSIKGSARRRKRARRGLHRPSTVRP